MGILPSQYLSWLLFRLEGEVIIHHVRTWKIGLLDKWEFVHFSFRFISCMIITTLSLVLLINNSFNNYLQSWIWLNDGIITGKEVKTVKPNIILAFTS